MNTPQDIYSNDYLRTRAKQVVLTSIAELTSVSKEDAKQLASMALTDAESNGCEDLDYLDQLYLASL